MAQTVELAGIVTQYTSQAGVDEKSRASVNLFLTPCYNLSTWECTFGVGGYRLPTEAEWEKAARGWEHNPYYDYPWGNSLDGSQANYLNSGDPHEPYTTPVGYYDGNQIHPGVDMANGYGLYDMSGNVVEWCNDRYSVHYYQDCMDQGIYYNPKGVSSSSADRVLRDGFWNVLPYIMDLRCAYRNAAQANYRYHPIGFRLALE